MSMEKAILFGYRLSSCTWRVRAALELKRIPYEERPVDIIRERAHTTEEYRAIHPAQKVPALIIDGVTLVESMAILQYLEDTRPEPRLQPSSPLMRARVREICETIVSGVQPLQNMGLLPRFEDQQQFTKFTRYFTERGLQTLEDLLKKTAGRYCVGEQLTVADLCLVPQVYNAVSRFKINLETYPTVHRLYKSLITEKIIHDTHPQNVKLKD